MQMSKERTKFNSGYDRQSYITKMNHEFIDIYLEKEKAPITRINVELVREMNEYIEKYTYFQRITTIINAFLTSFPEIGNTMSHKLLQMKRSVKQQFLMMLTIKNIVKNKPFDGRYVMPIQETIKSMNKRIDYLIKLVMTAYIDLTPLSDYEKKLKEEGKNLYDEIIENFPLDTYIGNSDENELVQQYIQRVMGSFSDSGNWKAEYEKYQTFLSAKYEKERQQKQEDALKKKIEHQESAEGMLMRYANKIRSDFEEYCISTSNHHAIYKIANRITQYRMQGREQNKIVLLARTQKGNQAKIMFYHQDTQNFMTTSINNCTILGEFDKISPELQAKIDDHSIAMVEVLL